MNPKSIVLHDQEFLRLRMILKKIQADVRADLVLMIDRSGQPIASEGPALELDQTALAALAAANVAATNGLAKLVGEGDFAALHHQGKRRSFHIADVAQRFSLVVVVDERASAGLVRWKVRRAAASLDELVVGFMRKCQEDRVVGEAASEPNPSPRFTEEEIDRLVRQLGEKQPSERKA